MTGAETTALLRIARTIWPDLAIQPATITAWTWALEDLPYPAVEAALKTWMRTSAFMPKPADLRKLIAEETAAGEPWEAAWDELMRTIRQRGVYLLDDRFSTYREGWPGWSSPEVEAAVRHIGYREVCAADTDALGILRAQFRDAYRNAQQRRIRDAQTGDTGLAAAIADRAAGSGPDRDRNPGEPTPIAAVIGRLAGGDR